MTWRIGEMLVQKKLISWEQLQEALEEQKKTRELTGEILVRKGFVSRHLVYKTLAEQAHLRYVDLKKIRINQVAVEQLPREIACRYSIMPIELDESRLTVAVPGPMHTWPESEIMTLMKLSAIQTVLCLPEDIQWALEAYYGAKEEG